MTAWRLVPAGVTLREQINHKYPHRDKASDGAVGDAAHAARYSDHNPDARGWVHAIDIDENMGPGSLRRGKAAKQLADELIAYAKSGRPGSGRIKYVVYENKLASGTYRARWWQWRPGSWGHTMHIHVSFTEAAETDGTPFPLRCLR